MLAGARAKLSSPPIHGTSRITTGKNRYNTAGKQKYVRVSAIAGDNDNNAGECVALKCDV